MTQHQLLVTSSLLFSPHFFSARAQFKYLILQKIDYIFCHYEHPTTKIRTTVRFRDSESNEQSDSKKEKGDEMRPPVRFPARGTRLSIMSHTSYRQELHLRNASIPWLTPHTKWTPCLRHVDFLTSIVQSRGNNDTSVWKKRQMPPSALSSFDELIRRINLVARLIAHIDISYVR
ncbi:uncharacterized protein LOC105736311 [Apis florea]|uniref:uncharacterized protein LOC105736311 n=1 Tax=Apis florea TaxID=7463 RepID=UPI0012FEC377|nr:uncharacterized protein LOC105736311 [Apis florea]